MCRSLHLRFYQNVSPECPALLISLQSPLFYQNTCKTFTTLIFEDIDKSVWKINATLMDDFRVGNYFWEIFEAIQSLEFFVNICYCTWSRNKFLTSGQILIKITSAPHPTNPRRFVKLISKHTKILRKNYSDN